MYVNIYRERESVNEAVQRICEYLLHHHCTQQWSTKIVVCYPRFWTTSSLRGPRKPNPVFLLHLYGDCQTTWKVDQEQHYWGNTLAVCFRMTMPSLVTTHHDQQCLTPCRLIFSTVIIFSVARYSWWAIIHQPCTVHCHDTRTCHEQRASPRLFVFVGDKPTLIAQHWPWSINWGWPVHCRSI